MDHSPYRLGNKSMDPLRRCCAFGLTLATVVLPASRVDPDVSDRSNLDLPYNAGGDAEEEDSIQIVRFYNVSFEANAIVFCLDKS